MKNLTFIFLILSGCASNPALSTPQIQVGDSQRRLERIYGAPTFNVPSVVTHNARAFYYVSNRVVCGFTVQDEIVVRLSGCDRWTRAFFAKLRVLRDSEVLPEYQAILGSK